MLKVKVFTGVLRLSVFSFFAKQRFSLRFKQYLASVVLVWLAIALYRSTDYYQGFLYPQTQFILLILATGYSLWSYILYMIVKPQPSTNKSYLIITALKNIIGTTWYRARNSAAVQPSALNKVTSEQKTAILFGLVKLFFVPLMINFLINNYQGLGNYLSTALRHDYLLSIIGFNTVLFPLLLSLLLIIDTAYFTFGYLVESNRLGNRVKSVDPTILGWIVALICYPPFNILVTNSIGWYANDHAFFYNSFLTFAMRLLILSLMIIYVWASVALGAKASNLTNRGIVARGPYRYVRHPAYVSKNLVWWLTLLPILKLVAVLGMLVWSTIYYLRAVTEERHLRLDPDYKRYCQKVPYRFIPGIW